MLFHWLWPWLDCWCQVCRSECFWSNWSGAFSLKGAKNIHIHIYCSSADWYTSVMRQVRGERTDWAELTEELLWLRWPLFIIVVVSKLYVAGAATAEGHVRFHFLSPGAETWDCCGHRFTADGQLRTGKAFILISAEPHRWLGQNLASKAWLHRPNLSCVNSLAGAGNVFLALWGP